MLYILEKFLISHDYTYLRMDGMTSIGARQKLIKDFNEVRMKKRRRKRRYISFVGSFYFCVLVNYSCWRARAQPDWC